MSQLRVLQPDNDSAVSRPRRAEEIVDAWLDPEKGLKFVQPVDLAALRATAVAYSQMEQVAAYFEEVEPRSGRPRGPLTSKGVPRPAMRAFFSAYREVMAGPRAIGATPAARAEMFGKLSDATSMAASLDALRREQ